MVTELIQLSQTDWDAYETSWDFTDLPLLRPEFRGKTLAATYAGLKAANAMGTAGAGSAVAIEETHRFVLEHGVRNNHLTKYIAPERQGDEKKGRRVTLSPCHPLTPSPLHLPLPSVVDASLIGVAVPYGLLAPDDPTMQATIKRIEAVLHRPGGGVYRYLTDTYYGGGEWVLLAAWLGWYYAEVGEEERARELLRWIEAHVDAGGHLPEQVKTHLLAPEHYAEWETRWGPIASPLLWSHAMYLILQYTLEGVEQR